MLHRVAIRILLAIVQIAERSILTIRPVNTIALLEKGPLSLLSISNGHAAAAIRSRLTRKGSFRPSRPSFPQRVFSEGTQACGKHLTKVMCSLYFFYLFQINRKLEATQPPL